MHCGRWRLHDDLDRIPDGKRRYPANHDAMLLSRLSGVTARSGHG
jgi:hypothetical protein